MDVGYLVNVMSALGVAPSPVFEHLLELLEMTLDEHAELAQQTAGAAVSPQTALARKLGKLRGLVPV